jgi:sulfate adenylyltransferase subunit 2
MAEAFAMEDGGGKIPIQKNAVYILKLTGNKMDYLDKLESQSIYILRESYREFKNLAMLWSIGKDSTVLLWLAKKAFFGHVPFPLVHIDTSYKIPEMIEYRNKLALEWKLNLIVGQNKSALLNKQTFPDGNNDRITCCKLLKTEALRNTLSGEWIRYKLDHSTEKFVDDDNAEQYTGVIVGVRADEEGSRSKERYFSPRDKNNDWDVGDQPPELWNQFKTDFAPGTHIRVHPLLDWTEINIWEYLEREQIPIIPLYFDRDEGKRYRSLGCFPCTKAVDSTAKNVKEIIEELKSGKFANIAERSGREQDKEGGGTLEELRRDGYM